jgi:type I restriction enzyme M protein
MLGAFAGDIIGSIYEFNNIKTKEFPLFSNSCFATDDSVMTAAVCNALIAYLQSDKTTDVHILLSKEMRRLGNMFPNSGYGGSFQQWLRNPQWGPYNSYGNGSAMRVSAAGWLGNTIEEVTELATYSAEVTHNHPEGIKGAVATAVCIFLARKKLPKEEIRKYINEHFYNLDFTLDEIRDSYMFNEICQDTVPQAIEAFLEGNDFEDAIRNAISIGGDSDTIGAITGSIAEAYWEIPEEIKKYVLFFLPIELASAYSEFKFFLTEREKTKDECINADDNTIEEDSIIENNISSEE